MHAMPAPGLLLVLSAPSGAGKTTLARRLAAVEPDAHFSISATTRAPRGDERDGVDYHFVSGERFDALVAAGALAEWAEVHGNRYGTTKATVEEALAQGHLALFDIDVQGGAQIRGLWPSRTATVFILPPSMAELERRLRARSTDAAPVIAQRLAAAREEIARGAALYDYLLVNDDLERALGDLRAIVARERGRQGGIADPALDRAAGRLRRGQLDTAPWLRPAQE